MRRRDFIRTSGLVAATSVSGRLMPESAARVQHALADLGDADDAAVATDEAFWRRIRAAYVTTPDLIDLDNANTSPTATPVFDAFVKRSRTLRHAPSVSFGAMWDGDVEKTARPALARYLGTAPRNLAFMANSTAGLNTIIHGFPMTRGDEILVTNHEYPDMIESVLQRGKREGIGMRVVPVPAASEDRLALVTRISEAITPRTKLLLLSHVSAWSGEVLPVAEVTRVARERGVAVVIDAAQSVGVLDVDFDQIGCDFLVTSLHKWVGAPIGVGALVMRPEHVGVVWPLHPPSWDTSKYPMDVYEWSGTVNMAAPASFIDALEFQRTLGAARKRERLRHLGDYWIDRLGSEPRVRVLTPRDPARSFGVAAMMIDGVPSAALAVHLRRRKGIVVQDKAGRHSPYPNAVRVSPGVYTTPAELDRFVAAVRDVVRNGVPAE